MYMSHVEMDWVLGGLIIQEALSLLGFASSIRMDRERGERKKKPSPHAGRPVMSHQ